MAFHRRRPQRRRTEVRFEYGRQAAQPCGALVRICIPAPDVGCIFVLKKGDLPGLVSQEYLDEFPWEPGSQQPLIIENVQGRLKVGRQSDDTDFRKFTSYLSSPSL